MEMLLLFVALKLVKKLNKTLSAVVQFPQILRIPFCLMFRAVEGIEGTVIGGDVPESSFKWRQNSLKIAADFPV